MLLRDEGLPSADDSSTGQRKLVSLQLVEPLMLASLHRPGLGEGVTSEQIVKAQSTLLFRTIDLCDRIQKRLLENPERAPFSRRIIVREIVGLIASHWRDGSTLTAADLAALAEHAVASGMKLVSELSQEVVRPGDDSAERLSSAVAASAQVILAMRDKACLGHDAVDLCKEITGHMAKLVVDQAARMRSQNQAPQIQSLIQVCAGFYPVLWDGEITAATRKFSALSGDPEKFRIEVERLKIWPLDDFFRRVSEAMTLCIEMAATMQQLLDSQLDQESSPNP